MSALPILPAVMNALLILGLVLAIFAVIARGLFADTDPNNFGTITRSYFTLFQVWLLLLLSISIVIVIVLIIMLYYIVIIARPALAPFPAPLLHPLPGLD